MRQSLFLFFLLITLMGSDCNHLGPEHQQKNGTHPTGPTLPEDPTPPCIAHPTFPLVITDKEFTPKEVDQIEQHFLAGLANYQSALTDARARRIRQTIQLLALVAREEDKIAKGFRTDKSTENVVKQLQIDHNLIFSGDSYANFQEDVFSEHDVRQNAREGAALLAMAGVFLNKHPNSWRDFFENAFWDFWTCIPARVNKLRPWIETRINGRPTETAVFYIISSYKSDFGQDFSTVGDGFNQLTAMLMNYYRDNVLARSLYEKPINQLKNVYEIQSLPEFTSHFTRAIVTDWIYTHVKASYDKNKQQAKWQATPFSNKSNIDTALSKFLN